MTYVPEHIMREANALVGDYLDIEGDKRCAQLARLVARAIYDAEKRGEERGWKAAGQLVAGRAPLPVGQS